jgi:hypothetical protein
MLPARGPGHHDGVQLELTVAIRGILTEDSTASATLATRNTADFEETGIELINPWKLG